MELQQMRYVVAVAQERSFTRAAERCHVVQSALSHQIKALERELGVTLFARSSRRVEPTAAGEAFLTSARASLDAADRAIADAAAASGQIRGTLNVGAIPTVTAIDLPQALAAFRGLHPAVRVGVRTGGSDEFLTAIAEGSMDVALLGLPEERAHRGVAMRTLAHERLVAVVGGDHPLAGRSRCRLRDLGDSTFVDFPPGTPGRAQSDLAFERAALRREVAFEAMSIDLILGLVRNGLAVALLAPGLIPEAGDLHSIALADGPTRVQCLAWSDFNASPAARAFVESL
ncbi:LysR family transcriptional regulator [Microbacterium sp. NPDC057650]|uniref:LysR family transcriptional regulator n=1 Tax=unclassified Microbacterium TaxID=2609290 RepID=UPI0036705C5C